MGSGPDDDLRVDGADLESPAPPQTPSVAEVLFGDRLALAESYVALLADTGISHGLIGPREAPRLWDRHLLGCAVLADVLAPGARVADIGSGAGLPGLVLAIRRPDLEVTLVEPLHRRVVWLESAIEALGLTSVRVHEGRAESLWGLERFDVVTARAVARIGVLTAWSVPLLVGGGRLVALKGATAAAELAEDVGEVRRAGGVESSTGLLGVGVIDPPATIVTVRVGDEDPPVPSGSGGRPRARRGEQPGDPRTGSRSPSREGRRGRASRRGRGRT